MKINNDIELYRCECGEFSFLEVWYDGDFYYFMITYSPRGIIEKLKAIWAILRGAKYGVSEDIVLSETSIKQLKKFIENKTKK